MKERSELKKRKNKKRIKKGRGWGERREKEEPY